MQALREQAGGKPARALDSAEQVETHWAPGDGWLVCARCTSFVAEESARIEISGAHAHSFINPEGAIFRVGCFAAAPGVAPWGEPSQHWTWFAGFEWQAAACRRCATHLGWLYTAEARRFVALILDRVLKLSSPGPAST